MHKTARIARELLASIGPILKSDPEATGTLQQAEDNVLENLSIDDVFAVPGVLELVREHYQSQIDQELQHLQEYSPTDEPEYSKDI